MCEENKSLVCEFCGKAFNRPCGLVGGIVDSVN